MGRKPLFDRSEVLDAINRWIAEHGVPPTVRELKRALGVGSIRTVSRYLALLEEEGEIQRWSGARGLRPLKAPRTGLETLPVPIVGEAPAGALALAEQNIEGWVRLPVSFARPPSARFFLLRVRGNSMNRAELEDERLENRDLALVRQQDTADEGQIVVALIDGEATIKRLARAPGYVVLKPDSTEPGHRPIVVTSDFRIQGVVCRVLKRGSQMLNLLEE